MQNKCIQCTRELTPDDVGATKKLINRGSTEFMCIPCLAKKFGVTVERIEEKVEYWRSMGCTLFPPKKQ